MGTGDAALPNRQGALVPWVDAWQAGAMTQRHKPYSTRSILVVGLIMAIGFSALSLLFLYMQARNTQHRVAGEVISISEKASISVM